MKSSDRNDGPLVSLEVDFGRCRLRNLGLAEAAFVEAFAKFEDAFSVCQRGLSLKLGKNAKNYCFACKFWQMALLALYS